LKEDFVGNENYHENTFNNDVVWIVIMKLSNDEIMSMMTIVKLSNMYEMVEINEIVETLEIYGMNEILEKLVM
jgi:hypothetical protein